MITYVATRFGDCIFDNFCLVSKDCVGYQAACGTSTGAMAYIRDFAARTGGYEALKRKAVLDGMLFEVFFDAEGKLRRKIKGAFFDEVFELQRVPALKASFDFIANALVAANADFHVAPGTGHDLPVTVSTTKKKTCIRVDAIYIGGANVLKNSDDAWDTDDGEPVYYAIPAAELVERLSKELAVPSRNLKVSFTPPASADEDQLRIAIGWTARK